MFDERQGHIHTRVQGLDQCLFGGGVIIFLGSEILISVEKRWGHNISSDVVWLCA